MAKLFDSYRWNQIASFKYMCLKFCSQTDGLVRVQKVESIEQAVNGKKASGDIAKFGACTQTLKLFTTHFYREAK